MHHGRFCIAKTFDTSNKPVPNPDCIVAAVKTRIMSNNNLMISCDIIFG